MASHEELNAAAAGGGTFADRVKGAMLVCAQAIITEADAATNHANRLKWAKKVYTDLTGNADDVLKAVVSWANAIDPTITPSGFDALTDATITSYVSAVVNVFADGT